MATNEVIKSFQIWLQSITMILAYIVQYITKGQAPMSEMLNQIRNILRRKAQWLLITDYDCWL